MSGASISIVRNLWIRETPRFGERPVEIRGKLMPAMHLRA